MDIFLGHDASDLSSDGDGFNPGLPSGLAWLKHTAVLAAKGDEIVEIVNHWVATGRAPSESEQMAVEFAHAFAGVTMSQVQRVLQVINGWPEAAATEVFEGLPLDAFLSTLAVMARDLVRVCEQVVPV